MAWYNLNSEMFNIRNYNFKLTIKYPHLIFFVFVLTILLVWDVANVLAAADANASAKTQAVLNYLTNLPTGSASDTTPPAAPTGLNVN